MVDTIVRLESSKNTFKLDFISFILDYILVKLGFKNINSYLCGIIIKIQLTMKKTINFLLVFIISFGLYFALAYNYSSTVTGRKVQDIIALFAFIGIMLGMIKIFSKGLNPSLILIATLLGISAFSLPHALTHLPWMWLGIIGLIAMIIGVISGYLIYTLKNKKATLIILLIAVIYSIAHYLYIHPWVSECVNKQMI